MAVSHLRGTLWVMTETRIRALRVRLDVNDAQAGVLLRRAGARRVAYNFAVEMLRRNGETWRRQTDAGVAKTGRVTVPSHFDLIRRWTGADGLPAARDLVCRDRKTGETWWGEHPAQMFEAALKDARDNYGKYLRGEARPPRFLARHRDLPRFRARSSIKLEARRLSFQGSGGWLRIAHTCPGQARLRRDLRRSRATVRSVTVKRDRLGRWWATLTYTQEQVPRQQPAAGPDAGADGVTGPVVGVDLGVRTLAVAATSDGTVISETASAARYKAELAALRRAQRVVARRTRPGRGVKQSANRPKALRRVAVLHDRIRSRRSNDLHHVSKAIVAAATGGTVGGGTVVVEDLNVAGMTAKKKGFGGRGRGFNRAVADQGFGELRRQLTYKAATAGVGLLAAPRFYPSSKTCASCGAVRPKLSLDERIFSCEACGHTSDRDVNAARNLAAWGETELGIAEPATQDGDRDPRGPAATPGDGEPMWHACGPASAGHQTTAPGTSGAAVGGGTGRDEAGTRQLTASRPQRQRGTSRTGTSITRRDEPITTRS